MAVFVEIHGPSANLRRERVVPFWKAFPKIALPSVHVGIPYTQAASEPRKGAATASQDQQHRSRYPREAPVTASAHAHSTDINSSIGVRSSDGVRWGQIVLGVVCMVAAANIQYAWTLFVPEIQKTFG